MNPVEVSQGDGPVVLALPHTGTWLPAEVAAGLNQRGRALADTDWHVQRLYAGLRGDVTTVRARFHRYVVDANRDPGGESLYPGQNTTSLVPLTDFDGRAIWTTAPTPPQIAHRCATYHGAYHAALRAELDRVQARHGCVILYDCHSIRSHIPYLFDAALPDLNIGTNDGTTCDPTIQSATVAACMASGLYSWVLNGRFRGGWTTRHYGRPDQGVHAIQMELAQSTYLAAEMPPWSYDRRRADRLRPTLGAILTALADLSPTLGASR